MDRLQAERIVVALSGEWAEASKSIRRAYTIAVHQIGERSEVALLLSRTENTLEDMRKKMNELIQAIR